ncbi:hypothetical protein L1887_57410 [Cichorium endivia]|nr:hypothetical protein L1887_57410 [Cichorium endivia]
MIRRKGRNEDRKDSGRQQAVFDRVVFSGQWQDARSERHFRSIDAGLEKQKLCVNLAWELFTERLEGFKNEFVDEELKRRRRTCKEQTTMKTTYEHLKQFVELSIKAIVRFVIEDRLSNGVSRFATFDVSLISRKMRISTCDSKDSAGTVYTFVYISGRFYWWLSGDSACLADGVCRSIEFEERMASTAGKEEVAKAFELAAKVAGGLTFQFESLSDVYRWLSNWFRYVLIELDALNLRVSSIFALRHLDSGVWESVKSDDLSNFPSQFLNKPNDKPENLQQVEPAMFRVDAIFKIRMPCALKLEKKLKTYEPLERPFRRKSSWPLRTWMAVGSGQPHKFNGTSSDSDRNINRTKVINKTRYTPDLFRSVKMFWNRQSKKLPEHRRNWRARIIPGGASKELER